MQYTQNLHNLSLTAVSKVVIVTQKWELIFTIGKLFIKFRNKLMTILETKFASAKFVAAIHFSKR